MIASPEIEFRMELALALGMTVAELCDRMTANEMALWRARWNRSPWGDRREDVRHAMRLRAFVAVNTRKGKPVPELPDFFPYKSATQGDALGGLMKEMGKAGNIKIKRV